MKIKDSLMLNLSCAALCACFMNTGIALAVPSSSTNYGLDRSMTAGGGGQTSAAGQSLSGVVGQSSPLGDSSSASYDMQPGFLAGLLIPVKNMSFLSTTPSGPTADLVDSTTGAGVGTPITFFNSTVTPIAGVPIDVDGDGVKEYAVVAQRADNLIMCQVRQTDGTLIKAFFVTNATQADVLDVYAAQMDGVAGEELVVGKVRLSDNQPVVAVHNPSTGAKNMETYMFNGNWAAERFFAIDVDGDAIMEVALGAIKANGLVPAFIPANRPGVQIRDGAGALLSYVFPLTIYYTNVQFESIDTNGDGTDEVIALGQRISDGAWIMLVQDAGNTVLAENRIFDSSYTPTHLMTGNVDGAVGEEVILGGTLNSNGRAVADVRDAISGVRSQFLYMLPATYTPDQYAVADWDSDGIKDIIVREYHNGNGDVLYMARQGDNTLLYNGLPSGISGTGDVFTGGM